MKLRIATALILLAIFVLGARAQSNCCQIQTSGPTKSGISATTVPPSAAGPGGTYIANETVTYGIACKNSQTSQPCNSANMPNNAVTAVGAGANFNGKFVDCSPSFSTQTNQSSPSSGAAATFTNSGLGWTSVNSNGVCVPMNPQPATSSTCIVVACSSGGGTGGGPPCPVPVGSPPYGGEGICWSWDPTQCAWVQVTCNNSPILIDVSGKGFDLTNAAGGVTYDIAGNGLLIQMAWTAPGAQNAFLCLPDGNGSCNTGKQLFGNFTPQPASPTPNGFAALGVYDGNHDGVIDARDAIFSRLRLWIDSNHDGVTQPDELFTLPALGITSISLNYKWDQRTDQYGNEFRYRAQVERTDGAGRMAYDVFFATPWSGTKAAFEGVPAATIHNAKGGENITQVS